MLIYTKKSTAQQLIDLSSFQSKPSKYFITAECRTMEDPSGYRLEKLFNFQSKFCTIVNCSNVCFTMSEIYTKINNSFTVDWLVPSCLAIDLLKSANQIKATDLFQSFNVASLHLGNGWLYNHQQSPFGAKLKEQYQMYQYSPSPVEWIPSPTRKMFQLNMIQRERVQEGHIEDKFVRKTVSGRVDDIPHVQSPVKLEHIFTNTVHESEIMLIEGALGSGKSTLTVHICQRWGKGELFQQFTVVILVQLRDPAVQRAQTIADLLAIKNVAVAQELATELIATNGRGVLWVLDGWDELPLHLQQDSIFCKLLPPKPSEKKLKEIEEDPFYAKHVARNYSKEELWLVYLRNNAQFCTDYYYNRFLNECSIIVTSRPIPSGDLRSMVSLRIELLGFTPEVQREYFTECLKEDTNVLEALLRKIEENPVVQSICYLPLNAVFIVYNFQYMKQSLPNTEYEIYSTVILSCIQHHFEKEGKRHALPRKLASLDDLSGNRAVSKPFQYLCKLACRGVIENKVTFPSRDLPQGSERLSLVQAIESFLQSRMSVLYSFLHLSIQEVLSAYYIATSLSDRKQVSHFQQLFNQPQFASVFQFYSAITKLKSPKVRQVIDKILEAKSKPLLVSLLRCLYEAQNPALCQYVAERLEYKLDLSKTSLCPLDSLSISFFLSSVAVKAVSANLTECFIGDLGVKCLAKYLGSDIDQVHNVAINFEDNQLHKEGASCIAGMLYFIENLRLSKNSTGDTLMSESVRETTTLKTLIFRALAQNSSLEKFDIVLNDLGNEKIAQSLTPPPDTSDLVAKVDKDTRMCTLINIDTLRRRIFAKARLADVVYRLVALEESKHFVVSLRSPSIPTSDLIETAREIEGNYFDMNSDVFIHVGNLWLYNSKLTPFGSKLRQQYQQSQGSPSPVEWIPSPTKKIFRLAMIQRERVQQGQIEDKFVQMTIRGRVDDILHAKSPVELQHIFRNILHGSEIILIEGAPGSGKSTLTVHICQRWGKRELFQQFTVVILVQLRDPAVQRARTIADLLPVENVAAHELAAELIATNGRGVLWVLDGWDELPSHLQQRSIFRALIPLKPKDYKERLLHECSVIVTSRPISSGDLHPVVSSRIEVLGFTPEEQRQYFTECLMRDTKSLEALLEKIQESPVVQSICYLPLNAAFVVHSFKMKGQLLANTVYEVYLTVILSCIQRHFEREGRGHVLPRQLESLYDLSRSEAVREPFQCICELAYRGVMKNKVTFSSSDLPQGSNTLSLLQAIESFLQSGKSVFYNFLHLSIQEMLSAYYIATRLSDNEQVSQFQQLFNQPRFAVVFQFYAAITKLKGSGIQQVIARIVEQKSEPLLVSLLCCLYEAQDPFLCLYVAEKLNYELSFCNSSLSPLDCLAISFFLSSVSDKEISVNLWECRIGDVGAKCLTKYLCSDVDHLSKVIVHLGDNEIHEEGASYIAKLLYFIEHLYLSSDPFEDAGVSLISEAVRGTVTLKTLSMYKCGVTSKGAEDLSRALANNNSVEKLDIGGNYIGDEGIWHVAEALKHNTQLKELWISDCGMTDQGAASLASALKVNKSLKMLHIGGGVERGVHLYMCDRVERALTEDGVSTIALSLANKIDFAKLAIPYHLNPTTIRQDVNKERIKNGFPLIEIEGKYCKGCVCIMSIYVVFRQFTLIYYYSRYSPMMSKQKLMSN